MNNNLTNKNKVVNWKKLGKGINLMLSVLVLLGLGLAVPAQAQFPQTVIHWGATGYGYGFDVNGSHPTFPITYPPALIGPPTGTAAFGHPVAPALWPCSASSPAPFTDWPNDGDDIFLKKSFTLPIGATNMKVSAAFDDYIHVFINTFDVSNGLVPHGGPGCARQQPPNLIFTVPDGILSSSNTRHIRARDVWANIRYVDVEVTYDLCYDPNGPTPPDSDGDGIPDCADPCPRLQTTITTFGTPGPDSINGTSGNDLIFGLSGNDVINGFLGDDCIVGGHGNDTIRGHRGNDIIWGGEGNDILRGGLGNDKLYGEHCNDILFGDHGNDLLDGGIGNDRFWGGWGDDKLLGREGADIFNGGPNGILGDYCHGGFDLDPDGPPGPPNLCEFPSPPINMLIP
jgi:hypothetical protein